jgi:hypothetical protein
MPVSNDPPEAAFDIDKYVLDVTLKNIFRGMLERQDEKANPIIVNEQAKLMAHAASGFN